MPGAEGDRCLLVGGIGQHLAVEADEHREGPFGASDAVQHLPSLGRIGVVKVEGQAAPLEQVPDLVGPGRPALADHRHHHRLRMLLLLPVSEELGDEVMEPLVGGPAGLGHVAIDLSPGDGLQDRPDRGTGSPGKEQDALRTGMERVRLVQEIDAGHPGHGVGRQKNDHRRVCRPSQSFQPFQRSRRRRLGDHLVVSGVPAEQLSLDRREFAGVLVNRHQDWLPHGALQGPTVDRRKAIVLPRNTSCYLHHRVPRRPCGSEGSTAISVAPDATAVALEATRR